MNQQAPVTPNCPTVSRCLQYHDDFSMLSNIQAHSKQVARVAAALYDLLEKAEGIVSLPQRPLVVSGALLHDIAKTECLRSGCRHAEIGAQICADLGYPEISAVVAEHVLLPSFANSHYELGEIKASGLVYYADKRVLHDQIVSLDQRLEYIIERYGQNNEVTIAGIHHNFATCYLLEKQLFSFLDIAEDAISGYAAKITL